jgi:hypothetical protein
MVENPKGDQGIEGGTSMGGFDSTQSVGKSWRVSDICGMDIRFLESLHPGYFPDLELMETGKRQGRLETFLS